MSTTLHLIRHGLTDSNAAGRYMGRSDEPINPEGRWQTRRLARRLRERNLTAVYCSPVRRAVDTATIVAGPQQLDPIPDAAFTEMELSRWAGRSGEEIAAAEPELWQRWCDAPEEVVVEGVEPLAAVHRRVDEGIERLRKRHPDGEVAIVTHDVIVRMAVLATLDLPLRLYRSLPVANSATTRLELTDRRSVLRTFNDASHADQDAERGPADG